MSRSETPSRTPSGSYSLWFGLTALTLVALTLVLVLVVLPRRYVLNSGLRESGVTFPTTGTPFTPSSEARRPAAAYVPAASEPTPGPAEAMWSEVEPLLAQDRPAAALPVFEAYLRRFPDDRDVLREYAITLRRAGRSRDAVPVLGRLVAEEPTPDLRRMLARTLRDLGRPADAGAQYARLAEHRPGDTELILEWARSWAWAREYGHAEAVLLSALRTTPSASLLRAELARVYYEWNRLEEAALEPTPDTAKLGTVEEERPPPTALDRARRAVADEDYAAAAEGYAGALAAEPDREAAWIEYADVLQYRLEDDHGARAALLEAETLSGGRMRPSLEYRLAQLAAWTDHTDEAIDRLEELLDDRGGSGPDVPDTLEGAAPEPGPEAGSAPPEAEIRAFLGDVRRWTGDRPGAVVAYEEALEADPRNERAQLGLETVRQQVREDVRAEERPRLEADAYSIADSDEFARIDLGAEAVRLNGLWSLRTRTGGRWLQGSDRFAPGEDLRGFFLEVEPARWWRWGTIRTAFRVGWENIRPGESDVSFGGSLRAIGIGGVDADLRLEHGPAYPLTTTLASALSGVRQDRLSVSLRRTVAPRWSVTLATDAARLRPEDPSVAGASSTTRLEGAATLFRRMSPDMDLGLDVRGLRFTDPAPRLGNRPLFWDPHRVLAAGLVGRWTGELSDRWGSSATLRPGLAFLHERSTAGGEVVPHLSAEAGLVHVGERFRTELGVFYLQGRFDGYRSYGLRVSLSTRTGGSSEAGR